MIEINLLPEELRKKESVRLVVPEIPIKKTLVLIGGIVFLLQVILLLVGFGMYLREAALVREIAQLKTAGSSLAAQKAETAIYQDRVKELRSVTARKFYWTNLLDALTASMTRGVWLTKLYIQTESSIALNAPADSKKKDEESKNIKESSDKTLVLEGSAIGAGQETAFIGKFLQSLKDNAVMNDIFSDIRLSDIQQRRIEQVDAYDFKIYCRFRKDKA